MIAVEIVEGRTGCVTDIVTGKKETRKLPWGVMLSDESGNRMSLLCTDENAAMNILKVLHYGCINVEVAGMEE